MVSYHVDFQLFSENPKRPQIYTFSAFAEKKRIFAASFKKSQKVNPGKKRCEYLKEVRKRIATENGIPFEQHECTFKGECSGTCPFCEAELHYLEKELHRRRTLGKAVTVAGIALSSVMLFPACGPKTVLEGEPEAPPEPDTTLTVTDLVPADTVTELVTPPPPPPWDPEDPPIVGMIDEESNAPLELDHTSTATAYSRLEDG